MARTQGRAIGNAIYEPASVDDNPSLGVLHIAFTGKGSSAALQRLGQGLDESHPGIGTNIPIGIYGMIEGLRLAAARYGKEKDIARCSEALCKMRESSTVTGIDLLDDPFERGVGRNPVQDVLAPMEMRNPSTSHLYGGSDVYSVFTDPITNQRVFIPDDYFSRLGTSGLDMLSQLMSGSYDTQMVK